MSSIYMNLVYLVLFLFAWSVVGLVVAVGIGQIIRIGRGK